MKYDFYHYGSDIDWVHELKQLPLLDWESWLFRKRYEFKRRDFTGKYEDVLYIRLTLFRRNYCLSVYFNHGETTPELAKKHIMIE